jgi:hypothetical protein
MFEVVVDEYRRAQLRKFPYAVFFEFSAERIIVDAVFHCSQDPAKWQARLRGPRLWPVIEHGALPHSN